LQSNSNEVSAAASRLVQTPEKILERSFSISFVNTPRRYLVTKTKCTCGLKMQCLPY